MQPMKKGSLDAFFGQTPPMGKKEDEVEDLTAADIAAMSWPEGQEYWSSASAPGTASTTTGSSSATPMDSPKQTSSPPRTQHAPAPPTDIGKDDLYIDFDNPDDVMRCIQEADADAGTQVDAELFKLAEKLKPELNTEAAQTQEEQELAEAINNGVDLHSGLGQRFLRAVRAAKKSGDPTFESYVGSRADKDDWRRRWAQDKYQVLVESTLR